MLSGRRCSRERELRQGAGGRAAADAVARGCLSGEATAEQRWKDTKGRHPGARVGGDASRTHGAPWWKPDWCKMQEFQWAGPGEP